MVPLLRRDRISCGYFELMLQHNSRTVRDERNFKVESAHFFWDLPVSHNTMVAKQGTELFFSLIGPVIQT